MANLQDIDRSLYDDLTTVMGTRSDVSDADQAVVLKEEGIGETLPAVSYMVSNHEIDGSIRAVDFPTDANGDVNDVTYCEENVATIQLDVAATDRATLTDVYDDVRSHFIGYASEVIDLSNLHADATGISIDASEPAGRPDGRGAQLIITVDYKQTFNHSDVTGSKLPPASEVEVNVDGDNDGTHEFSEVVDSG